MTSETAQLKRKLSALIASLDDLEASLEPLFDQSLLDSLSSLETIQQAKLNAVVPYLVYDLIFVYLKSRGIDPKTHPVVGELDRVRQYFAKISNAENAPSRSTTIDKAAATRFIKHALSQAQAQPQAGGGPNDVPTPPAPEDGPAAAKTPPAHPPVKVTSKMIERERYQKLINDLESEEEEDLEIFDDEDEVHAMVNEEAPSLPADANESRVPPSSGAKRERPRIDPFAGYGEDMVMDAPAEPSVKKARSGPKDESSGRNGDRKAKKSKKKLSLK